VLAALAIHMFGVYSLSVRLLGGMSPIRFFRGVRLAMVTAFSTLNSLVQENAPDALKGRILSIYGLAFRGGGRRGRGGSSDGWLMRRLLERFDAEIATLAT